jgi:hypothetical protein
MGRQGFPGASEVFAVASDHFYHQVYAEQGSAASEWAEYRARRAEWLFRTVRGGRLQRQAALNEASASLQLSPYPSRNPTTEEISALARVVAENRLRNHELPRYAPATTHPQISAATREILSEALSSVGSVFTSIFTPEQLERMAPPQPALTQAERVRRLITQDLTPIALPWNYEPESSYEDHLNEAKAFFDTLDKAINTVLSLLLTNLNTDLLRRSISNVAAEAEAGRLSVADDLRLVGLKEHDAALQLAEVQKAFDVNVRKQEIRKVELEQQKVRNELIAFAATAAAVFSAIGAAFPVLAAVGGMLTMVVKVNDVIAQDSGFLTRYIDYSKETPELRPEWKDLAKSVDGLFESGSKLFSAAALIQKASAATGDPQTDALLAEAAQIAHEKAKLQAVYGQHKLEREIVRTRSERKVALSKSALDDMVASRSTEIATQDLILALLDEIRLYADTAHRHNFFAIRHAQRWLFESDPLPASFGYGWVDPDTEMEIVDWRRMPPEADARRALAQKGISDLLKSIVQETKLFEAGEIAELRERYFTSSRTANFDHLVIELGEFAGGTPTMAFMFHLSLTDLPDTVATIAHIESVHLQLDPPSSLKAQVRIGRRTGPLFVQMSCIQPYGDGN